jgi:hypothetical protein
LGQPDTLDTAYAEAVRWGGIAPGSIVAEAHPLFPRLQ